MAAATWTASIICSSSQPFVARNRRAAPPLFDALPAALSAYSLTLEKEGQSLVYRFDTQEEQTGIAPLLRTLHELGIDFKDLHTRESSLEEIFVSLVHEEKSA